MQNDARLIKPEKGFQYHLVNGPWDEESLYIRAITPAPISLERSGDNDIFDQFMSRDKWFIRNVRRATSRTRLFFNDWLQFIQNFALSIIDGNIDDVIIALQKFSSITTPEAFRDFINFSGTLKNTMFCLCPLASILKHQKGPHKGKIVFRADFSRVHRAFFDPEMPIMDKLEYCILAEKARLIKAKPYDLLLTLFAGRKDIPTKTMQHLCFENPFARILQGHGDAETFLNARRCLKDSEFKGKYHDTLYAEPPGKIMKLFESKKGYFSLGEKKDDIKSFMAQMPGTQGFKIAYLMHFTKYESKEIQEILGVWGETVSRTKKKVNK
jgi:hypothetical protein